MDIKKIYIDMDGVLADFDGGLLEFLGIEPRPQEDQPEDYQIRMWQAIKDYGHFILSSLACTMPLSSFGHPVSISQASPYFS